MRSIVVAAALFFASSIQAEPPADARIARAKLDIRNLDLAVTAFKKQTGNFPAHLKALVDAGYVEPGATLRDPWGNAYKYEVTGKRNGGKKPDVWCVASDKVEIGNWPEKKP